MPILAFISPRTAGKTTNAAWTAQVLYDRGEAVFGFDADESHHWQQWDETSDFDYPVIGAASAKADSIIKSTLPDGAWGVVDVGHLENHLGIGRAAMRIADLAIINCAATISDAERVRDLPMKGESPMGFLDETATYRRDGEEVPSVVLMTRVPRRARATVDVRNTLENQGLTVLETVVPDHQKYAQTGEGMQLATNLDQEARRAVHADMLDEVAKAGLVK